MRQTAFVAAFFSLTTLLPAADPTLLNLVMPDAKIVGGVNVTKAETSPFGQFVLRSVSSDKNFAQFVSMTGFDPRADLTEILFASNATPRTGLALARGTFHVTKLAAAAMSHATVTSSTYDGARLLISSEAGGNAIAIYPDSDAATLAIVGDLVDVKAALDRQRSTNAVNPLLASKIAAYSGADVWSVSIAPLSTLPPDVPKGPLNNLLQSGILQKVQQTSGGVTFSSPVQVTGEAIVDTPQDASALGDVIRFLASMVQSSTGAQSAGIANVVQTLNVTTVGNTVKLALSIPEAQLENLLQSGQNRHVGVI